MKKNVLTRTVLCLLMAAMLIASLAACSSGKYVPPADKDASGDTTPADGGSDQDDKKDPEPSPAPEPEPQPAPDQEPEPEPEPEPMPEPEPQPIPDPEPDAEIPPDPDKPEKQDTKPADDDKKEEDKPETIIPETPEAVSGTYSGSFSSDTGTALNVITRWAANENSDGSYSVALQFFLKSYDIFVGTRSDNTLTIKRSDGSGTVYSFSTAQVSKPDGVLGEVYLGGTTVTLSADEMTAGTEATVNWNFKGSYSGTDLPVVESTGTISAN